ncbi:hypothetical protein A8F94_05190 [Bacillus sp. FJAT-27225]|uniref:hypothetical protein n=1 Tax=Bacillus sp. FJAT-27225 TaxID=1743144 RepID=UPI00080C3521|nr:hypothetical protein [Bacillus sp. FJAT-27225]OCA91256.1 hypothetical protein A8F94_05190 [Bacillus sp. FJAT-27225]
MDKPKKNTITIKINGDSRPYKEELKKEIPKKETVPLDSATSAEIEQAAALETGEESFDWILPELEPEAPKEYIIKEATDTASIYPKPAKSSKPSRQSFKFNTISLKPLVIPIIFAILIGVTFGTGMLKMLGSGDVLEEVGSPIKPVAGTSKKDPKTSDKKAAFTLLPLSTFAVQEGVYTKKDSAESKKDELVSKGIPAAVLDMDGKAMMLVGVADSLEKAKEVGAAMKAKGIEIYAKEVALPEKDAGKLSEQEAAFLKESPALYNSLSGAASAGISGGSPDETAKQALAQLKKTDSSKFKNENVKKLYNGLLSAATLLSSTPDEAGSIKAQQHLLDFLVSYQSF